jgi:hypothetical protein
MTSASGREPPHPKVPQALMTGDCVCVSLGKKRHWPSVVAVQIDRFAVQVPNVARTQALSRMDIVVRNDGVRLLHEHCIRVRTKQKYEESDTPKGTPVLLFVGAGEAIHERLMRARGKAKTARHRRRQRTSRTSKTQ